MPSRSIAHTATLLALLTAAPLAAQTGWLGAADPPKSADPEHDPVGPLAGTYGDTKGLDLFAGIPVQAEPKTASRFYRDGRQKARLGQHRLAVNRFRSAYKRGHDRVDLDFHLGPILNAMGKHRHALFHIDKALALGGPDPALWTQAGEAFQALGNHQRAIQALEEAVRIDPGSGEAHYRLALAYDQVDNSPKVLEHAQRAIRIDPSYKAKLKPAIRGGSTSRKIGRIVDNVLKDSKNQRLSDEQIEGYAEEIGTILGEDGRPVPKR